VNDTTHSLLGTQRLVRAIRKVATSVARSEIASAHQLATVTAIAPSNATLSTALTSGTAYTSLSCTALGVAIASGANVVLQSGSNTQTFVAASAAAVGATSIPVNSLAANYSYPTGTYIDPTTLTVTVDGSSTAVAAHYLKSYTPAINDRVWCEVSGRQVVVFGTYT